MSTHKKGNKLPLLGAIFAVQLVIAGFLLTRSNDAVVSVNEPLLVFNSSDVSRIVIEGSQSDSLSLSKVADGWQMGDSLPVLQLRVDNLLENLGDLKVQWPVANTDTAAERFEVAEDNFRAKVTLYADDQDLGAVLIGTTPSFNKTHMRRPGEEDIYALRFSAYDASAEMDNWLETTLLQPAGELAQIQSQAQVYTLVDGAWSSPADTAAEVEGDAQQGSQSEEEDAFQIEKFVEVLSTLRVIGVAEDIAEFDALESDKEGENTFKVVNWSVKTSDTEYQYQMLSKDEQYYLRRNDYPQTFKISKYQFDNFSKIRSDTLNVAKAN